MEQFRSMVKRWGGREGGEESAPSATTTTVSKNLPSYLADVPLILATIVRWFTFLYFSSSSSSSSSSLASSFGDPLEVDNL